MHFKTSWHMAKIAIGILFIFKTIAVSGGNYLKVHSDLRYNIKIMQVGNLFEQCLRVVNSSWVGSRDSVVIIFNPVKNILKN